MAESGGIIRNCYARVDVTTTNEGSAFGLAYNGEVFHCYGAGSVSAVTNTGFGGAYGAAHTQCYFDVDKSGPPTEGPPLVGEARTTEQMTYPHDTETTYVDWEFGTIWVIDPERNDGYPLLDLFAVVELCVVSMPSPNGGLFGAYCTCGRDETESMCR